MPALVRVHVPESLGLVPPPGPFVLLVLAILGLSALPRCHLVDQHPHLVLVQRTGFVHVVRVEQRLGRRSLRAVDNITWWHGDMMR